MKVTQPKDTSRYVPHPYDTISQTRARYAFTWGSQRFCSSSCYVYLSKVRHPHVPQNTTDTAHITHDSHWTQCTPMKHCLDQWIGLCENRWHIHLSCMTQMPTHKSSTRNGTYTQAPTDSLIYTHTRACAHSRTYTHACKGTIAHPLTRLHKDPHTDTGTMTQAQWHRHTDTGTMTHAHRHRRTYTHAYRRWTFIGRVDAIE